MFSAGKAADALAASMAVPILFKPVWDNGRPLIDGAVGDVAGVAGLGRSERVLYHHVSLFRPTPPAIMLRDCLPDRRPCGALKK